MPSLSILVHTVLFSSDRHGNVFRHNKLKKENHATAVQSPSNAYASTSGMPVSQNKLDRESHTNAVQCPSNAMPAPQECLSGKISLAGRTPHFCCSSTNAVPSPSNAYASTSGRASPGRFSPSPTQPQTSPSFQSQPPTDTKIDGKEFFRRAR